MCMSCDCIAFSHNIIQFGCSVLHIMLCGIYPSYVHICSSSSRSTPLRLPCNTNPFAILFVFAYSFQLLYVCESVSTLITYNVRTGKFYSRVESAPSVCRPCLNEWIFGFDVAVVVGVAVVSNRHYSRIAICGL